MESAYLSTLLIIYNFGKGIVEGLFPHHTFFLVYMLTVDMIRALHWGP
jgi:hypothetical protein